MANGYVLEVKGRDYKTGDPGAVLGAISPEEIHLVYSLSITATFLGVQDSFSAYHRIAYQQQKLAYIQFSSVSLGNNLIAIVQLRVFPNIRIHRFKHVFLFAGVPRHIFYPIRV